jgi:hypothetical protein
VKKNYFDFKGKKLIKKKKQKNLIKKGENFFINKGKKKIRKNNS